MIRIVKNKKDDSYAVIIANAKQISYTFYTPKELEQLYKKIGKIVGRGKDYCPYCKAGLK